MKSVIQLLFFFLTLVNCSDEATKTETTPTSSVSSGRRSVTSPTALTKKDALSEKMFLGLTSIVVLIICLIPASKEYKKYQRSLLIGINTWFFTYENIPFIPFASNSFWFFLCTIGLGIILYSFTATRALAIAVTGSYVVSIILACIFFIRNFIVFYILEIVVGCVLYFLLSVKESILLKVIETFSYTYLGCLIFSIFFFDVFDRTLSYYSFFLGSIGKFVILLILIIAFLLPSFIGRYIGSFFGIDSSEKEEQNTDEVKSDAKPDDNSAPV